MAGVFRGGGVAAVVSAACESRARLPGDSLRAPQNLAALRAQQIRDLEALGVCRRVDSGAYEVPVGGPRGGAARPLLSALRARSRGARADTPLGTLTFAVLLAPTFPETPPDLRLRVRATHPWVTPEPELRIIGHQQLRAWSVHTSLGAFRGRGGRCSGR